APGILPRGLESSRVRREGCATMRPMVSIAGGRLTAGCVCATLVLGAGRATEPPRPPSREQVLQRIPPATVQVSLEQDGHRVRSGSGVVVAARSSGQDSECFVLTSGHTLAGFADPQQVFVLFDRHRGKKTKVRARLLAQRENAEVDLALLQVR